ncbi:MAG: alpha/beta hydrolase [Candidatus Thorarchaeota archaeon]|jgi:hypothetical protein
MQILENPQYDDVFEEVFQIQKQLFNLYTNEKYVELSQVISDSLKKPGSSKLLYDWAIGAAALRQDIETVERYLEETLQQGIWFSESILRENLETIADLPHVRSLIIKHEKMYIDAKKKTEAQLLVRTPSRFQSGRKYPLILFLDGRHSDHTISQFYWKPALERIDIVFASLRSSQIHGFGQYAWDNENLSLQEVREAYEILRQRNDVDETRVIVSGMSQGAGIALQAIARGIIPARGFLTIAQALGPVNFFNTELPSLIGKKLRGVIVSGEKDESRHPSHKKFYELAVSSGIDCEFFSYPDIGHEYPDDFCTLVKQSVNFILDE